MSSESRVSRANSQNYDFSAEGQYLRGIGDDIKRMQLGNRIAIFFIIHTESTIAIHEILVQPPSTFPYLLQNLRLHGMSRIHLQL